MEAKIINYDHFGRGIAKINNEVLFISKALKDEIIDYKLIKKHTKYSECKINKIIKESKTRIKPICPYYDLCGGCTFMHTTYEEELNFKLEKGKNLLKNINKIYETKNLNYRNKIKLHVKNNKIGLYNDQTNNLININYCYLVNNEINNIIKRLNNYLENNKENIQEITIKQGNKILLDIKGNISKNFIKEFTDTIIYNNNKLIHGENSIIKEILDYKFSLRKNSFFQVNEQGIINIYNIINEYLKDKKLDLILDLYSGISFWGILLSKYANKVISIEYNKDATKDAINSVKLNNIKNLIVVNSKVEDVIDKYVSADLVIIDPPRSGLDKHSLNTILNIKSNYIIYISCDMMTLKRDLEILNKDYKTESINLVDMFKRTYHVESVVILKRK